MYCTSIDTSKDGVVSPFHASLFFTYIVNQVKGLSAFLVSSFLHLYAFYILLPTYPIVLPWWENIVEMFPRILNSIFAFLGCLQLTDRRVLRLHPSGSEGHFPDLHFFLAVRKLPTDGNNGTDSEFVFATRQKIGYWLWFTWVRCKSGFAIQAKNASDVFALKLSVCSRYHATRVCITLNFTACRLLYRSFWSHQSELPPSRRRAVLSSRCEDDTSFNPSSTSSSFRVQKSDSPAIGPAMILVINPSLAALTFSRFVEDRYVYRKR